MTTEHILLTSLGTQAPFVFYALVLIGMSACGYTSRPPQSICGEENLRRRHE